ncbi:gluconokinase [Pedobacter rhizosphaerae]|uniref:Gluconokinase n=1 Tax=Pedobacter rhizosphaerae TaxID=390241 RepID=A0A1H9UMV3_9SPHI|nr:gluconokinase [Pedobacter rhizosphaerae]SES10785.1 gluconokinase [Pedobacter rhizosphaerae]
MSITGSCVMIMGVSGSGKTAVGKALAKALHAQFLDADDFHPAANISKMSAGIPLTDDDRKPWLVAVAEEVNSASSNGETVVLACSALKKAYRILLGASITSPLKTIYLKSSFEQVRDRLEKRRGHFMPANLLKSQFDALEEPDQEEADTITLEVNGSINDVTQSCIAVLK